MDKNYLEELIADHIINKDLFLVEVAIRPGNIIVVEVDSDRGVGIDDCIDISRFVESKLDRDEEDFELEVGSSGLTSPFKIPRQYQKNLNNEVEVLTKDGQKLTGILKSCNETGFVLTVVKKVKPEGAKKKVDVEEDIPFLYDSVKYTKYLIRFK